MPRLVIFDESVRGVDLPRQPLVIGRSKRSDIPIRDRLLSRKHCAIVPMESGFKIVDLKSSYGTFLNGNRVEREDLTFDDVIEIGSTVIAYLDTAVWSRGEGLARLRNPIKAQELIQRINLQPKQEKQIPIERMRGRRRKSRGRRALLEMLPLLMDAREDSSSVGDDFLELLVDYATFKTVSIWLGSRPEIKPLISRSVEDALLNCRPGNWEDFRQRLREALREELGAAFHENL